MIKASSSNSTITMNSTSTVSTSFAQRRNNHNGGGDDGNISEANGSSVHSNSQSTFGDGVDEGVADIANTATSSTTRCDNQTDRHLESAEYAKQAIEDTFRRSKLVNLVDEYPKFELSELQLGPELGKGGYGIVFEISGIKVDKSVTIVKSPKKDQVRRIQSLPIALPNIIDDSTNNSHNGNQKMISKTDDNFIDNDDDNNNSDDDDDDSEDDQFDSTDTFSALPQINQRSHRSSGGNINNGISPRSLGGLRNSAGSASSRVLGFGTVMGKSAMNMLFNGADGDIHDDEVDPGELESRQFIAQHCLRNGGDARYAIKQLKPSVIADPDLFLQAIYDMAIETRVLSSIEHPHIIKLRAISNLRDPFHPNYFLILDRLYDTLGTRLKTWKRQNKQLKKFKIVMDRKGKKRQELFLERLMKAFDLCAALEYMHSEKLLYRDLKPENIGFDIRDDIKIFDFGLSKEIHEEDRDTKDGTFQLTAMTGTPRYMAPEVALGLPYNESCDTYSFAILLWEILALKRPHGKFITMEYLQNEVWALPYKRPELNGQWSANIRLLLSHAWSYDPTQRQSMNDIYELLRKECVACRGGNDSDIDHSTRRSTFIFKGDTSSPLFGSSR